MAEPGPRYGVSVAATVVDDRGLVLAVRRRGDPYAGRWEMPGGVLEPGETLYEGVIREVLEETGVTVEPGRLTGVYQNMARGRISLVFRCRVVAGQPKPTDEAAEVRWLTPAEVRERMDESRATRLLDGLKNGSPAVRLHNGISLLPDSVRQNP